MRQHEASRTLVKSPPELWAECSDAAALARHLGGFGEIRITRLDPETAVAWEGEHVRGTVRIEPAGWGTKVILTAEQAVAEAPPTEPAGPTEGAGTDEVVGVTEVVVDPPEAPEPLTEAPVPRPRRFARLRAFFRGGEPVELRAEPFAGAIEPEPPPTPELDTEPAPEPAPEPSAPEPAPPVVAPSAETALAAALDSLGQAHHRPYSRA
ncbi:MAG TPA: hypothetical protein VEF89_01175 [Solirubrobacteraceae bacterium]|nr:hypothetical protein [Solirubrobacteraceae bacterium]